MRGGGGGGRGFLEKERNTIKTLVQWAGRKAGAASEKERGVTF